MLEEMSWRIGLFQNHPEVLPPNPNPNPNPTPTPNPTPNPNPNPNPIPDPDHVRRWLAAHPECQTRSVQG